MVPGETQGYGSSDVGLLAHSFMDKEDGTDDYYIYAVFSLSVFI